MLLLLPLLLLSHVHLRPSPHAHSQEGRLIKLSRSEKRTEYHFFLFSDLIMYASDGLNTKYKMHRVIHLSLCRLEDLRSDTPAHAFKIISPQKTFRVCAPSAKKKQAWLTAILHHIRIVVAQRKKFLGSLAQKQAINSKSLSLEPGQQLLRPRPSTRNDSRAASSFDLPTVTPLTTTPALPLFGSYTTRSDPPNCIMYVQVSPRPSGDKPTLSPNRASSEHDVLRRYSTFIRSSSDLMDQR